MSDLSVSLDAADIERLIESVNPDLAAKVADVLSINGTVRLTIHSKFGPISLEIDVSALPTGEAQLRLTKATIDGLDLFGTVRVKAAQVIVAGAAPYANWFTIYKARDGNLRLKLVGMRITLAAVSGSVLNVSAVFE